MKNLFLFGFLAAALFASAQNKDIRIPNYSKMPYWIEMIKNPNVNYYDAITAYEEFWKGRQNPLDENAVCKDNMRSNTKLTSNDKRERILYLKYVAECKKFEHWRSAMKPLVQPDGRIISRTN